MSDPSTLEKSSPSDEDLVPLEEGKLREEDLPRMVEKIYQMLKKQLRLENEREGRMR